MINLFKKNYTNTTSKELIGFINDKNLQIIDVREPYEYASGHIPQAINIPLSTLPANLNIIDQNKKIVLVCASGSRSSSAAKFLAKNNYEVSNLVGGMMFWSGPKK